MIFAATVAHAEEVLGLLPADASALVTGATPGPERERLIAAFKARELKYLVNVAVLTTGFDAPHVDVIAILRPTESVGLYQQIVGRGLRLSPGKRDCLVLDYAGNPWDLYAPEIDQARPDSDSEPVQVECPECGFANTFWGKRDGDLVIEHHGRRCQGLLSTRDAVDRAQSGAQDDRSNPDASAGVGVGAGANEGKGAASGAHKERVHEANAYAELHCLSAFSFQRGASTADELFARAARLGYHALAITDEATLAGIVRAWQAARAHGVRLIVGAELRSESGLKLVLLVENRHGYAQLCGLLTRIRGRAPKGEYRLYDSDLAALDGGAGLFALWLPDDSATLAAGARLAGYFPGRLWLAAELHYGFAQGLDDAARLARWQALAATLKIPLVAAGDVHMHARGRRALQDCLTAIRQHQSVFEAGDTLFPNGERHLRTRADRKSVV